MNILVIDIGGTFIKYALLEEGFPLPPSRKVPTPLEGRESLLDVIEGLYHSYESVDGIAISMPGIIDSQRGYVVMGGALRYNDAFPFRDALQKRCPVPICIENDARCAALAEAASGSLSGVSNGMVLIFGTMIGGALIQNHALYRGSHFSAGEISYLITEGDGKPHPKALWGNKCSAIELCRSYARAKGQPEGEVDGQMVFAAARQGEKEACEVLDAFTYQVAVGIFNLQNMFDPERFAIGGGISEQPAFLSSIQKHLKALYEACPYPVRQAEVVNCTYFNQANLLGAYHCFQERKPA